MDFNGLMMTTPRKLEAAEAVRRATTETEQIAMKTIPKANDATGREIASEFKRQRPVTRARDILTQLLLVRREDADATPSA
jgi:hypothetical protein